MHKEIDRKKLLIDTPGDINMNLADDLKNLLKDMPIKMSSYGCINVNAVKF